MGIKIDSHAILGLPKLAWVASVNLKNPVALSVFHGPSMELGDSWIVEGIWDGDYQAGSFHTSENFFGSGIRVEGETIHFVSSMALVDHLFYCLDDEGLYVSNSLVLLLAFMGASLDETHDYFEETMSIFRGINRYQKQFKIKDPNIECFHQVYHENVVFSHGNISFEKKGHSSKPQAIASFEEYRDLLSNILQKFEANYKDPYRKFPVSAFSTLSSGYDSTAVTCLVKEIGVKVAFSARKSESWKRWDPKHRVDDGALAARSIDIDLRYLDPPTSVSEKKLYFLATNYGKTVLRVMPNEFAFHSMCDFIEKTCEVAVVFTGHHGDRVWDATNMADHYVSKEILRDDLSGLGLCEIRLKSGFIHVPLPFVLCQSIEDLVKISRSMEMEPWRLHNAYDRPIARRIAETSGVNRAAFGMTKKRVARRFYQLPMNHSLRTKFLAYLRDTKGLGFFFAQTYNIMDKTTLLIQKALYRIQPSSSHKALIQFWSHFDFGFLMWIWATHLLRDRFRRVLLDRGFGKLFR
jgi:hypothetical protein